MSDNLLSLGAGVGSANENIKSQSNLLRGTLDAQIRDETSKHLDEDAVQLLKFHGSYQQDDRDQRRALRETERQKAYQFMVRARIPGGVLTAAQYVTLDHLSVCFGNRSLRLTTRQGVQLHGVIKRDLKSSIRIINESLLSTLAACGDVNRNVMACPAPAENQAVETVQAFARQIALHLAPRTSAYHEIWLDGEKITEDEEEPIYGPTYLPRKFKIGVALPDDNCIDIYTQDLGFIAEIDRNELKGFTVVVGGGMGSTHGKSETFPRLATPLCFVAPDEVLDIARAVITVHRDFGDRKNRKHARLKYVVEEMGIAWVREEVERRMGCWLEEPHHSAFTAADDHLGWHKQLADGWCLGVFVANGRVVDRPGLPLRSALRDVVEQFETGVRITGQQNILLTDIPAPACEKVERILRSYGIQTDGARLGLQRFAMACPALPTCGLAVAEAERVLPDVVKSIESELRGLGLDGEPLSIRMTGCPNGCARPRMGDIGIVGRSLGLYDIHIGGDWANTRLNLPYVQRVKQEEIAAALRPAFERWALHGYGGESFGDFVHRASLEPTGQPTMASSTGERSALRLLEPAQSGVDHQARVVRK